MEHGFSRGFRFLNLPNSAEARCDYEFFELTLERARIASRNSNLNWRQCY